MTTPSRFDLAAATWDEHPVRVALSRGIVAAMQAQVPVEASMTAIDFGCGTGLVSLALSPVVARMIGIDNSPGMVAKLQEKIQGLGVDNVEARLLDLATESLPIGLQADLLVSAMALHHVQALPPLLRTFQALVVPGGYVALADLDVEDGSFHQDPTGVYHSGIDRDWLLGQLTALGFEEVRATTAHVVERPDAAGTLRRYPIFLVSGRRGG
jgi:predicted TPR repeat methyltransferase